MSKLGLIFPGQGSQAIGMSKSFYDEFDVAKNIFTEASDTLGFDMAKMCFEGPKEDLDQTENTQPAILTASVAALRVLEENCDLNVSALAGHSLGEYTALVASGALSFTDAVKLVNLRGKFMQEAVPKGTGAMAAIIGLDLDVIDSVCNEVSAGDDVVVSANLNSPGQIVISGSKKAVDKACEQLKEKGAKRALPLPVSVPSHSPLMEKARENLSKEIDNITINDLKVPVYSNVEGTSNNNKDNIKELLSKQLVMPVKWIETVENMKKDGTLKLLEVGPGKVLSGLVRRIDKEIEVINFSEASDLDSVKEFIK